MLIDRLLFSDPIPPMMKKALDFESQRHLLISSNISNMDTPGYKAMDVDFAEQLRETLVSDDELSLTTTNENHFGPSRTSIKELEAEVFEEQDAARSDGNNVDMDKEMMKLAENQLMYNAVAQLMTKRGTTVRSAVTEIVQ